MRLGQLARKLSLRPSQLVDFLSEKNIETQEGSNTRLDNLHVEWIVQEFAPERLDEILNPGTEEKLPEIIVEEQAIVEPEVIAEVTEVKQAEAEAVTENQPTAEIKSEEPEVIRVQKIELSGLKVLGKIELPEPKKKEVKTDPNSGGATPPEDRKSNRSSAKSKRPGKERDQRSLRNPIEAQRQREAREREEKRKADLEREKEKRKHHYQNKVKQVQQTKRVKPVKETAVVKKHVDKRPVPKTWLGRFLRWWTT